MVADFIKKQKRQSENVLFRVLAILFLILAVFLVIENFRIYQKKKELTLEINNYSSQIKKIEDSNKNLQTEIANSNNQDYIEKVAREEEDMQLPGEKVVSFILPKTQPVKPQVQNFWSINSFAASLNNFWQKIKNFFD